MSVAVCNLEVGRRSSEKHVFLNVEAVESELDFDIKSQKLDAQSIKD